MADIPLTPAEVEDAQAEFAEFGQLVEALRAAITAHTNARAVATNQPLSPGLLMAALLNEASTVCVMWGVAQCLRPEDIEGVFDHALRNTRRTLRGSLQTLTQAPPPRVPD